MCVGWFFIEHSLWRSKNYGPQHSAQRDRDTAMTKPANRIGLRSLRKDASLESRARPAVSFIAWTPVQGRSAEIAAALGGEQHCVFDRRLVRRSLVPLRYLLSTVVSAVYLVRRHPRSVIVTNPPLLPGFVAWVYGRLWRAPVVLDSHPGGFGVQGDRISERLQFAHRWLARRVSATMVTDKHWVDRLADWGGNAIVVHEAPPMWSVDPARQIQGTPRVLFVGTFGGDEPVGAVFAAAEMCPEFDISVTGDPRRCPHELLARVPKNLTLTGFLGPTDYAKAVQEADIILTLSTEPTSVMRAAYEAVYVGRPLVLSDWIGLRDLFPYALTVSNTADDIARGLRQAVVEHERLRHDLLAAQSLQERRWQAQLSSLRERVNPTNGAPRGLRIHRSTGRVDDKMT